MDFRSASEANTARAAGDYRDLALEYLCVHSFPPKLLN
jgi:hypothetical protein